MSSESRGEGINSFSSTTESNYDYIPVDFIKGEIIGLESGYFLNNFQLKFTPVLEKESDGVIRYEYVEDNNMKLRIYPSGRILISGSLHKYYNDGRHNFNQFGRKEFWSALERLKNVFGIRPQNIRILCLEYGFNINPPISANEVINNLMEYRNKDFEQPLSNDRAKYSQCAMSTYILKIYNKGKQYNQRENILRIEIKQKNWSKYRKKYSIITLNDFIESDKSIFMNTLLKIWDEVIFYDPTSKDETYSKYSSLNFWRSIRGLRRNTKMDHRRRLKRLNESGINVQKRIEELIINSYQNLQNDTNINFRYI